MNKKNTFKVLTGTLTAAALVVGAVSFTAITAIADEAVSYYGLSADGTVLSGSVTDYTRISSSDTAWGTSGKDSWYVADGDTIVDSGAPIEILGNVNVILKDNAQFIIENGIMGIDATVTFYGETENGGGIIAFMGAQGSDGSDGSTGSADFQADGNKGDNGASAVDVSSITVSGGTVTIIGGKGGNGGNAGHGINYVTNELYYGIGGNGGDGALAITDSTKHKGSSVWR